MGWRDEADRLDAQRGRDTEVHRKDFVHKVSDDPPSHFSFQSNSEHFQALKKKVALVRRKRSGAPPLKEEYIRN